MMDANTQNKYTEDQKERGPVDPREGASAGQVVQARCMTLEEFISARIERKQYEILELMRMRDDLNYDTKRMDVNKFEKLARLFNERHSNGIY